MELSHILKINWAQKQLEQLTQAEIDWFKNQENVSHRVYPNPDSPGNFIFEVSAKEIPVAPLSLVVGDIIQNIRNSLDHAVYELGVKNNHPDFNTNSHNSQFPIIGNQSRAGNPSNGEENFERSKSAFIKYISNDAQDFLKTVQPFNMDDQYNEHPLWLLNKLSNIDKHRFLHVGAGFSGSFKIEKCRIEGDFSTPPALIDENKTIIKFGNISPIDPEANLDDLVSPRMVICFRDGPLREKPIIETLKNIHSYVVTKVLIPIGNYL